MSDVRRDTDHALFGKDDLPRIVAVHPLPEAPTAAQAMVRVYQRSDDFQRVTAFDEPLHPFFFLSDVDLLRGFPRERFLFQQLAGDNFFQHLVVFRTWAAYWDAYRHIERATERRERRPDELYVINNPAQQYLMQTGRTCFKGMTFDDLHRLQLDIEVATDQGFPNPSRPEDAIIIVSLHDNRGWHRVIDARAIPEQVLLQEVVRVIQEQDPDVIEGHNCFPAGTPVLTPQGYRAIEELEVGDAIIGSQGSPCVDRVEQVHQSHYTGELVCLHAIYRNRITSTPDHPHFGYTTAQGLGWSKAKTFARGDLLALPIHHPEPLCFNDDAYLAGLIYADGHLSKASNRVSFGNTNAELIDYVCSRIPGHYRLVKQMNQEGQKDLLRVFTHDRTFRSTLETYGLAPGDKSSLNAPIDLSPVAQQGPSVMASFLAGVIDGDGHVTDKGIIHIACHPEQAKQQLFSFALHLGLLASRVRTGIYIYPTHSTNSVLIFIRDHLRCSTKKTKLFPEYRGKYNGSGRMDHLPPSVIDIIKPFVKQLGLQYGDFPLPTTTVNDLLNKRTSPRRWSIRLLMDTIADHVTEDHEIEWRRACIELKTLMQFQWFRINDTTRFPHDGPVYNIGTQTHTYIAEGILTHNCYAFDFAYLMERCAMHRIPFAIGRDGSVPRVFPSSMRFAERTIDFPALDIAGRHVVDTYFQVMAFDVFKRDLPGYGLKDAARYFGFAPEERTYVAGEDIARTWREDPERLLAYALDDVIETERLARHLSGSTFYLTPMLPMLYGHVARTGPATKIEALFVREYLRERQAIPKSTWGSQAVGGYTDVFVTGVVGPVVYADVESLYPSIMLNYDVKPGGDHLDLFPTLLQRLTELRFDAKAQMQDADTAEQRSELDARQSSYKVLINSFYGMLGFSLAAFNDFAEADRVAATGQQLLRRIIGLIRKAGGTVIEVDTDGVLFVPPPNVRGEPAERAFVDGLNDQMPTGIRIGFDGRFQKMLSYKKKNYALLTYDGTMKFKGSSLVSRSNERFGRRFVREAVRRLLDEDIQGLHDLYLRTRDRILAHDWPDVSVFARTETLKDTVEDYQADVEAGKRSRAASYELALQRMDATGQPIRKGDRITYYITGTTASVTAFENSRLADEWNPAAPDENTAYYLRRLDEFASKFTPFFTEHNFRLVFSPEDLFGFSAEGITLQHETRVPEETEDEVPF